MSELLKDALKQREQELNEQRNQRWLAYILPQIYSRWSWFPRNYAATKELIEMCNSNPMDVTLENVELLLQDDTQQGLKYRLGNPEKQIDQKAEVLERIKALLKNTRRKEALNVDLKNMGWWTLDRLLEREQEIIRNRSLANQSNQQLREMITPAHATSKYEVIPSAFCVPGKRTQVPWSFLLLKKLPQATTNALVRRYGWDQLNRVCQENELRKGIK
jgi:hypothetical protein